MPPVAMLFCKWLGQWLKTPGILQGVDDGYYPYFAVVVVVFVISLVAVYASPWYFFRGNKNGEQPISYFIRHFIGKILLGEGLRSFYGLFLFVLLAVITTA